MNLILLELVSNVLRAVPSHMCFKSHIFVVYIQTHRIIRRCFRVRTMRNIKAILDYGVPCKSNKSQNSKEKYMIINLIKYESELDDEVQLGCKMCYDH